MNPTFCPYCGKQSLALSSKHPNAGTYPPVYTLRLKCCICGVTFDLVRR